MQTSRFTAISALCMAIGTTVLTACQHTQISSKQSAQQQQFFDPVVNHPPSLRDDEAAFSAGIVAYHYYPDSEVYYCPDTQRFFWKGAGYWGVGEQLPSTVRLNASKRFTVWLDTEKPYRAHHQVSRHFGPAQLSHSRTAAVSD